VKITTSNILAYQNIAENIGDKKATRAVASAIAKNNIAYLIPCHRVIQSIGGLDGYKWGHRRKLSIIGLEKSQIIVTCSQS